MALALIAATLSFVLAGGPARAHGGEDHDHDPVPVQQRADSPRAYAESEDFELVASFEGERLLLQLDRWETNEAVEDAEIEVDSGGVKLRAQHLGANRYAVPGETFMRPGRHALVISVQTGELADLLVAHLDVPEPAVAASPYALPAWMAWAAVGGLLLAAIAFAAWRHRARGGAA
jgi:hypothetical protein